MFENRGLSAWAKRSAVSVAWCGGLPQLRAAGLEVRSIVSRYREHSRIFAFGAGERRRYYIGSADLMPRDLDRRWWCQSPIPSPELQERLQEILDVDLADDTLAWELGADGAWAKAPTVVGGSIPTASVQSLKCF